MFKTYKSNHNIEKIMGVHHDRELHSHILLNIWNQINLILIRVSFDLWHISYG